MALLGCSFAQGREGREWRRGYRHVAFDTASLPAASRCRRAWAVAIVFDRAGVRPDAAAALLLFQSGRCQQPDLRLVLNRCDLEASGDHAMGIDSGVRDRLARWRRGRVLVRAPAQGRRDIRSLCENGQCTAARRAGADFHPVAGPRHLVEGRARRHAGVLHRVFQCLPGRQGSLADRARQRPHARHERAATDAARLLAVGAVVDVFLAAHVGRFCRGWRGGWRISGIGGRARLPDPAGRGHVRRCRRVCRHVRAVGFCHPDRCRRDARGTAPAGMAARCRRRRCKFSEAVRKANARRPG